MDTSVFKLMSSGSMQAEEYRYKKLSRIRRIVWFDCEQLIASIFSQPASSTNCLTKDMSRDDLSSTSLLCKVSVGVQSSNHFALIKTKSSKCSI
jgi:hypothetical protein